MLSTLPKFDDFFSLLKISRHFGFYTVIAKSKMPSASCLLLLLFTDGVESISQYFASSAVVI